MKFDVILAGVGGQGVLSVAAIIAASALRSGLEVKQSEVHGMSQRGGTVVAHLRLSDRPIASDIVSHGSAQLLIGAEPLEALRQIGFLHESGWIVSSTNPIQGALVYPPLDSVTGELLAAEHALLVDADSLARESGSVRTAGIVLLGACSALLPIETSVLACEIEARFAAKGDRVVMANERAFRAGTLAFAETGSLHRVG